MSLNIAVVDDVRLDSEKLQTKIHRWFTENHDTSRTITCFKDGQSLLRVFEPEKFQMVFMDILMRDMNGIETARNLRARDNKALLIFTTASRDFAFDVFPLHPFDYLIKPYESQKLAGVLSEAVRFLETPEPVIDVQVSRSVYTLRLRDISAVMSRDHFVEVVMSDGRCILCSMRFRDVEAKLAEDVRFLACNRGIIINMDCVNALSRDRDLFIMKNGLSVPIRVRGRSKVINDFTQYQIARIRREAKK